MSRARRTALVLALSLVAGLSASACAPREPEAARGDATPTSEAGGEGAAVGDADALGSAAEVQPVQLPALMDTLDRLVRDRLEEQYQLIQRLEARPDADPVLLADAYGGYGQVLIAFGFVEQAEIAIDNARILSPEDPRWIYYEAHLHRVSGRISQAEASYRAFLEYDPANVAARVRLAELQLESGQTAAARSVLESVVAEQPDLAYGHMLLAEFAAEDGDHATAVEHYEAVKRLQPEATVINYPLALAYQRVGESRKSEETLALRGDQPVRLDEPLIEEISQIESGASYQLLRYGTQYIEREDYESAVDVLELAARERPDDAEVFFRLGQARGGNNDTEGAIVALERAMLLDPNHVGAPFLLSQALLSSGEVEAGMTMLLDAVERNPGDTNLLTLLATIYRQRGECAKALPVYERLLELLPADSKARIDQVLCRTESGQLQAALEAVEEGLSAAPGDPALRDAKARLLAVMPNEQGGSPDEALAIARSAEIEGRGLAQLETLAMAQASTGDFEAAIVTQEGALEMARESADESPLSAAYLAHLERMMARYRAEQPPDEAWPPFMLRPDGSPVDPD